LAANFFPGVLELQSHIGGTMKIKAKKNTFNLAKLDDGLDESPTVMVIETKSKKSKLGKNRGILKPSWTFVKTNSGPIRSACSPAGAGTRAELGTNTYFGRPILMDHYNYNYIV
jgi:hypothetical protein